MRVSKIYFLGLLAIGACRPSSESQTVASDSLARLPVEDTMALAQARFNPEIFDTVQWVTDSVHMARGADVFRWACATCHGATGKGDGGAVVNGDTLHPPSLVAPDWRFAQDEAGIRRRIFVGNGRGMPHWGLRGMQPGDIVAVQKYIIYGLRKQPVTR